MKSIEFETFLSKFKDKKIGYMPNHGNAGDSLIALGTMHLFDKLQLNWHFRKGTDVDVLFYGGGGNLIGFYGHLYNWLSGKKDKDLEIVILPHTIANMDPEKYDVTSLLSSLKGNVTVCARELTSFEYVSSVLRDETKAMLFHDLAFFINDDFLTKYRNAKTADIYDIGYFFREDREKTNIKKPANNRDISKIYMQKVPGCTMNRDSIIRASRKMFTHVCKYKEIHTNRLHVAIAGVLLNKTVNLYPNSYWKNSAIYNYSLAGLPNVHFHEDIK